MQETKTLPPLPPQTRQKHGAQVSRLETLANWLSLTVPLVPLRLLDKIPYPKVYSRHIYYVYTYIYIYTYMITHSVVLSSKMGCDCQSASVRGWLSPIPLKTSAVTRCYYAVSYTSQSWPGKSVLSRLCILLLSILQ